MRSSSRVAASRPADSILDASADRTIGRADEGLHAPRTVARIRETNVKRLLVVWAVVTATIACGGANSSGTTGQTGPAAGSGPAAGLTLVPHTTLETYLPALPGWTFEYQPRGDTDTAEGYARIQVNYARGENGMSIEIVDTMKNPNVLDPLPATLASDAAAQQAGLTRTTVGGFPGVQEWTPEPRNGEVTVLLSDRFVVKAVGSTVPDLATIRAAVEAVDLKKLAAVK